MRRRPPARLASTRKPTPPRIIVPAFSFGAAAPAGVIVDGRADEVAILRPASVVILDVRNAQKIFEHEPGVARTLADPAIGNRPLLRIDSLFLHINPLQFLRRL